MKNDQPAAAADGTPAGTETLRSALAAARAPWTQLREAVQQILGEQPSPHLVRTTARRISAEVQMTADKVINEREVQR
ncbi:hypothetical protein [Streptomyces stelliscabiei]|uniref:Tryptophan synthase beta subunit n=1 Tax=Streptomyces stelliscabiei TaxID=146820 RepID=A0A8I0TXE4_9ACTN|nr:hypothetical protein [Streptomyces stelliscabiei]KND40099.1 hypothetical protein IQ64_35860 [Streptomyces stelliscabiei]MBE1601298.1 tryptophan synthase beta subunit [Streptomyces stelliscabiei]